MSLEFQLKDEIIRKTEIFEGKNACCRADMIEPTRFHVDMVHRSRKNAIFSSSLLVYSKCSIKLEKLKGQKVYFKYFLSFERKTENFGGQVFEPLKV